MKCHSQYDILHFWGPDILCAFRTNCDLIIGLMLQKEKIVYLQHGIGPFLRQNIHKTLTEDLVSMIKNLCNPVHRSLHKQLAEICIKVHMCLISRALKNLCLVYVLA